ncbi:hypothetical protein F53441_10576 [Fusarium austroafricanum]|uniref:Uncharacterized protein n=1 Tax=Fusarium austroafricanum TaxID=2364996 RepID=A0A8H4K6M3_9HYPO|nr:hypothetical protein F53441_10576 [Fusarium austroafricanum]
MAIPSQPLTRETANPNAATAAASAFLKRESTPSLSSAAAAAALKARPTTPTNVSQVQSKRVARRSASVSSTGSRDRRGRELHRSPSASSMTERTFRSPSPSPARAAAPQTQDVPPVPKIPQHGHNKTDAKSPTHKRATSLQTQHFQTASQKMKNGQAQGSWFGAATGNDMSNVRRAAVADKRVSADVRPSSPSSINFSYPRSMTESPSASSNAMVYDPNSRRMVPQAQLLMLDQTIRDASEKPIRKHKHEASRSGTHLSKGMVGRLKGTAVEPTSPPPKAVKSPQSPSKAYTAVKQQPEQVKQVAQPDIEHESELESDLESEPKIKREAHPDTRPSLSKEQTLIEQDPESDVDTPRRPDLAAASPPSVTKPETSVRKRPSVVHEAPGLEEKEERKAVDAASPQEHPMDKVDAIPVKSTSPPQQAQETAQSSVPSETMRRNRVHSESPARTTHFAPKTDQLLVRHEPPPRSLSPRKSALKYSSPRDASPSEDGSDASAAWSGMAGREDSELLRKKSVRVSFDDGNTAVIGESVPSSETDSPQIASPQSKKSWHSIIGRNKRDSITLDEEETMTPRPALPSFGSIREKKVREPEERPLVRPMERSSSPPTTASPASQANNQSPFQDLVQSNDQVIGSVLAQEQASRNEANTSRYREPLPPVVTSVDGQGYISNSDLSSDDESEPETLSKTQTSAEPVSDTQTTSNPASPTESDLMKPSPSDSIPTISIIQPSPRIPDENQPGSPQDFFDVPGGLPAGTSTVLSKDSISKEGKVSPLEYRLGQSSIGAEPPAPIATRRSFESTSAMSSNSQMHDIQEESEESDGSSIYSDAYEDLSDMEGDGFLSLDAVVDSPVESAFSQKVFEKAIAKSKEIDISQQSTPTNSAPQKPSQTPADWETAKAYWRSLSLSDRRQLEKEAMEETDEEHPLEETARQSKFKSKTQAKQKLADEPMQQKPLEGSKDTPISEKLYDPNRVYQIQPGTSWPRDEVEKPRVTAPLLDKAKPVGGARLRKSMRGTEAPAADYSEPAPAGGMRKSMRSGAALSSPQSSHDGTLRKSLRQEHEATATPGVGMRRSLRANGSAASGQKTTPSMRNGSRPTSYQPAIVSEPVKTQRRTHSEDRGSTLRSAAKPTLTRRGSDSSESSFRRAKTGSGEGFGFRKTMRGSKREQAAAPPPDNARGSSRFSLRSLSPTGSAFRRNSNTSSPPPVMMGGRMRQSLRSDPSDAGASRMRVSGFGRSSKGKKSKSGSRFEDSSDEDESRPAFRSRFVDSSDEDTPSPLPKQKRVPKTMRNSASNNAAAAAMGVPAVRPQDSPDLPDSDDEEPPRQNLVSNGTADTVPRATLNRSGSGRDGIAPQANNVEITGSRPGHKRRGSFMSSILRRKKDPANKISRSTSESASRRDTHLERGPERLAFIRSNSEGQAHGRLHKRGANWPLQDHQNTHEEEDQFDDGSQNTYVVDEEKRPSTAGGLGPSPSSPTAKTGFLKRRSTSHSQMGSANNALLASIDGSEFVTPKKKKFGTLRRMFKLDE